MPEDKPAFTDSEEADQLRHEAQAVALGRFEDNCGVDGCTVCGGPAVARLEDGDAEA